MTETCDRCGEEVEYVYGYIAGDPEWLCDECHPEMV